MNDCCDDILKLIASLEALFDKLISDADEIKKIIKNLDIMDSYLITTEGKKYQIDDALSFSYKEPGGLLRFQSEGETITISSEEVFKAVLLIPASGIGADHVLENTFMECTNLEEVKIVFENEEQWTVVGDNFCYNVFYNTSKLRKLEMKMPPIRQFGEGFCSMMFFKTSLEFLPKDFNFPVNADKNNCNEQYYCDAMFSGGFDHYTFLQIAAPKEDAVAINTAFSTNLLFKTTSDVKKVPAGCCVGFRKRPAIENYIAVQIDSNFLIKYKIDCPEDFITWAAANMNSNDKVEFTSNGETVSVDKGEIVELSIEVPFILSGEQNICAYLCYEWTSLVIATIYFQDNMNFSYNDNLFESTFYSCYRLRKLDGNFPMNGGLFNSYNRTFYNCYCLTDLPECFELPADEVFMYSCNSMFQNCLSLKRLPPKFSLPLSSVTEFSNNANKMFCNCESLESLPSSFSLCNFKVVEESFEDIFKNCYSLRPGNAENSHDCCLYCPTEIDLTDSYFIGKKYDAGSVFYIKGTSYESSGSDILNRLDKLINLVEKKL